MCPQNTLFLKGAAVMEYLLSPAAMQKVFMLPSDAVKSYMKTASAEQLRVLLSAMCDIALGIDPDRIATELSIPLENVTDALDFWCDAGVFSKNGTVTVAPAPEKRKVAKTDSSLPTREEITLLSSTDEKLTLLLREAESKFSRPLRFSEIQSLAYLYADISMSASLILMLVEYARSQDKLNITYINKTARAWLNAGVTSVADAEKQIEAENVRHSAWGIVKNVFGIADRKPSEKELSFCEKWVVEWGFKRDMLKAAYDACIDANSSFSMPYINKILENWHSSGFKAPEDVKKPDAKPKRDDSPSYDKELFKKMINRD